MRNSNARSLFSAAIGLASAVLARSSRRSRRAGRPLAPQQGLFSTQSQNLEDRSLMTDLGGNSIAEATNLGTDADHYFSDYAGTDDRNDYYRFSVSQRSSVRIDVTNLSADIDIRLMNANQSILASSTRGGSDSELINVTLDAGTYFVHVYPWGSASSRYTMSLDVTALVPPDRAGNTFAEARNIGTINSATTFSDYVSASGDRLDYYRFSVTQTSNVSLRLNGLSANADVYLYDSQQNWITGSWNTGTQSDSINRQLNAGTYTALVYGNSGETNYNLRLQADAVTTPPAQVTVQGSAISSSEIQLTWNDASNEDRYRVWQWNNGWQDIGTVNRNVTSFRVTGLVAGQTQYFLVRSENAAGYADSSWIAVQTQQAGLDLRNQNPINDYDGHLGVDYMATAGTAVLSPVSGRVVAVGPVNGYGTMAVAIEVTLPQYGWFQNEAGGWSYSNRVIVALGHLRPSANLVNSSSASTRFNQGRNELGYTVGAQVTAGERLGYVETHGYEGSSTGSHIHVTILDAANAPRGTSYWLGRLSNSSASRLHYLRPELSWWNLG
jgi:murein DD-endopeptidase MepM/ murein hydrolase activator NlpD